jgi:hypothetical protein
MFYCALETGVMLTIQSRDTVGNSLTKYSIIYGMVFLVLVFVVHKYFALLLVCYAMAFIIMFIRVAGKRRVIMLKIQAKRLDIYFGGAWNTEIK